MNTSSLWGASHRGVLVLPSLRQKRIWIPNIFLWKHVGTRISSVLTGILPCTFYAVFFLFPFLINAMVKCVWLFLHIQLWNGFLDLLLFIGGSAYDPVLIYTESSENGAELQCLYLLSSEPCHTRCLQPGVEARKASVEASPGLPSMKQDERGTRPISPGTRLQVMQQLYAGAGWCWLTPLLKDGNSLCSKMKTVKVETWGSFAFPPKDINGYNLYINFSVSMVPAT